MKSMTLYLISKAWFFRVEKVPLWQQTLPFTFLSQLIISIVVNTPLSDLSENYQVKPNGYQLIIHLPALLQPISCSELITELLIKRIFFHWLSISFTTISPSNYPILSFWYSTSTNFVLLDLSFIHPCQRAAQ